MRVLATLSLLILAMVTLQACGQRAPLVIPENRVQDTTSH